MKIDKIKEELQFDRLIIGAYLASILGITSFVFINWGSLSTIKFIFANTALILVIFLALKEKKKYFKKLSELERI